MTEKSKQSIREKMEQFWEAHVRQLDYQEGYCTTCFYTETVEAIDDRAFEDLMNEVDKWISENYTEKTND